MTIQEDLFKIADVTSIRSLALSCGLVPSTLVRQLTGERPLRFETVMTVCRKNSAPFMPVLIAGGFLTAEEAKTGIADPSQLPPDQVV